MKDLADHKTMEIPEISATVTKKRGRPSTGTAKSAAQRKASQRLRDRVRIYSLAAAKWEKKDCLFALNDAALPIDMHQKAAKRLVEILCDNHKNNHKIKICGGDGIGMTECSNPQRKGTGAGQTWATWKCATCGGVGRSTWD